MFVMLLLKFLVFDHCINVKKCYKFNTLSDILTVYYKLKYILRLNWEDKILKMGGENSKIDTVKIPVLEIRANSPT